MAFRKEDGEHIESFFVRHVPCEECNSSDANSLYSDGHTHCFSCNTTRPPDGSTMEKRETVSDAARADIPTGTASALVTRGIHQETCEKWGYLVGSFSGKPCQIAQYRDMGTGAVIAAKIRFPGKEFTFAGEARKAPLYGQWLWSGGGKMLTITEGEIDALSVSQAQGNKFPVVSVQNGAQGALKSIKKSYEWICSFDRVNIWFDNDEAGRTAAREVAEALPPGKAHIVKADLKDANEYLQAGRVDEIVNLIWRAEPFRPDGIIAGAALWDAVSREDASYTVPYPYEGINTLLRGLRAGELVTVAAGTGVGKSAFVREIMHHLIGNGEKVGGIFLEESVKRSAMGLMGLHLNKPIHIDRSGVTEEELREAFDATVNNVFFYDHFGSVEVDNIINRIRYMAQGCGCKWVILDHISILMSGLDIDDERKALDKAMTMLRTLVEELGIGMVLVSHLTRPQGSNASHEEGAQVSLRHLRGSHSIGQLSDAVIGLERDQQDDEGDASITTVRVIKNRFTGETGVACQLRYDRETGRLYEHALGTPIDAGEPTSF